MNVMGQETYQIDGKAREVELEYEIEIPDEDVEMVAFGSNDKAMVFNTAMVPEKTTRSAQGVKTFNPGKRGTMIDLKKLEEAGLKDTKGYRARNLPAAGNKISSEEKSGEQLTLF